MCRVFAKMWQNIADDKAVALPKWEVCYFKIELPLSILTNHCQAYQPPIFWVGIFSIKK
ncbi:hypothetical protein DFR38_101184 [Aquitalea magnusonii]|uniref:Uncharacterized protein n=1 Tax=Aquitalea magnusonii TaxID=332411 RepID=A0A318JQR2_9NEIS|nr:hypothetical protein DFR38_101184 [Aquitalea magnusonii]